MTFNLSIMFTVELMLRILLAILCGGCIGYERKNRNKEAGVRTHLIVCMASCLMIIISKYGFFDVVTTQGISADASRVAAQIVSGVGFLGAGMIFVRKDTVSGLTTAAGIWATAGIGMAIGSGLYSIGIVCAVAIILVQTILHLRYFEPIVQEFETITIEVDTKSDINIIQEDIERHGYKVVHTKIEKLQEDEEYRVDYQVLVKLKHEELLPIYLLDTYASIRKVKK